MTATVEKVEQYFRLDAVDWEGYESFLHGLENRHVFLTYDRGRMELMSPSWQHDLSAEMIAAIIRVVAEETGLPIRGGGSTTFKREDLKRGLEPDRCFYIRNEPRIRGKRDVDLRDDPPPDLVIEVEISTRLLDRVGIYASMGVPELWRFDGKHLTIEVLQPSGSYQRVNTSPTFPNLPPPQVEVFLEQSYGVDETTWIRTVRAWVREHIVNKK